MSTIGLDSLFYAKITEDANGDETYSSPIKLAKAMTAELSVELAEAALYADDGASEIVKEFKSGTISLGIDDIGITAAQDLTGSKIDNNNVLISTSDDSCEPSDRIQSKKIKRKIPVLLALQSKVRNPRCKLTN